MSPLRLAAERYTAAASRQHLGAVLARYRQMWILYPDSIDWVEKYQLVLYAKAAANEIVLHHPGRGHEFSQLNALIEDLQTDFSEEKWGTFRRELLQVLPDLDDPIVVGMRDVEPHQIKLGAHPDRPIWIDIDSPPSRLADEDAPHALEHEEHEEHEEKGFRK